MDVYLLGGYPYVDELQRIIESEPQASSMITPYVSAIIGDLVLIFECVRQIETYQPWASTYLRIQDSRALEDELRKYMYPRVDMEEALLLCDAIAGRYGSPHGGRFDYPAGKRRTKENVNIMREAESALDLFWQKIDGAINSKARSLSRTVIERLSVPSRTLRRTSEWVEPVKKKQVQPKVETLYEPFSNFNVGSRNSDDTPSTSQPKPKIKTPGVAAANADRDGPEQAVADDTIGSSCATEPEFFVDARALNVFKTIFFTPSSNGTPGELAWRDFLHAMAALGFAHQQLGGSAFIFHPVPGSSMEKSIIFHSPHPNDKVPYITARKFGSHLNRTFGLDGRMFVLAGK